MMKIAIIDGTGRERPDQMKALIQQPQGETGKMIFSGKIDGFEVLYIPSQGPEGKADDSDLDYLAVLQLLKDQDCDAVLSASVCSSLREEIQPGECIIPNAFMDMTKEVPLEDEADTGTGPVTLERHKDLFSEELRDHLTEAAIIQGITVHNKGTAITVKNSKVLTFGEMDRIRTMNGDVLDHSTASEALAANKMGLPYARVMLCTAFDSSEMIKSPEKNNELQQRIDDGYSKIMKILSYAIKRVQTEELTD